MRSIAASRSAEFMCSLPWERPTPKKRLRAGAVGLPSPTPVISYALAPTGADAFSHKSVEDSSDHFSECSDTAETCVHTEHCKFTLSCHAHEESKGTLADPALACEK